MSTMLRTLTTIAAGAALAMSLGFPATASADGGPRWEPVHGRGHGGPPHAGGRWDHRGGWPHAHPGHRWGHHKPHWHHSHHRHGRPVYVVPHRHHGVYGPRIGYPIGNNEFTIIFRGVFD
jgi:hypothetical protein